MKLVYEKLKSECGNATLIAVSKGQPVEKIRELYRLGHRDFGENYAQELLEKAKECEDEKYKDIRWHFIGPLQRNKVKGLLSYLSELHSLDRIELAEEISKHRTTPLRVFIQVNIDDEATKSGVKTADVSKFVDEIRGIKNLKLEGFMCIPDPLHAEDAFQRMKVICDSLKEKTAGKLSMGMSDDYKIAIQNGATHIRIGTLLFGARR